MSLCPNNCYCHYDLVLCILFVQCSKRYSFLATIVLLKDSHCLMISGPLWLLLWWSTFWICSCSYGGTLACASLYLAWLLFILLYCLLTVNQKGCVANGFIWRPSWPNLLMNIGYSVSMLSGPNCKSCNRPPLYDMMRIVKLPCHLISPLGPLWPSQWPGLYVSYWPYPWRVVVWGSQCGWPVILSYQ